MWLKIAYSAFMTVLIPVYWANYGPTNFLYFCDVSLLLTLAGIWLEKPLLVSLLAVGILLPQTFWCIDFVAQLTGHPLTGHPLTGMTSYMFDGRYPLFLRGLSLFHGWLPFLLFFLVMRLGYDARALKDWTLAMIVLCLVAFFLLPPAGADPANPSLPRNVNYVFGLNDAEPQHWVSPEAYLILWMGALTGLIFAPTHALLKRLCPSPATLTRPQA